MKWVRAKSKNHLVIHSTICLRAYYHQILIIAPIYGEHTIRQV